jgi:phage recombination protein Bet
MSNELVVSQQKEIEVAEKLGVEPDIYRALKYSLFPDANDISIGMYLAYCRAKNYDPIKKPMHIVPIGCKTGRKDENGKEIYENRDVIMPGINSYRIDAMRTGQFYGISDPQFGPMITKKFGKNNVEVTFPEWCRIVIYKKIGDQIREIPATLYWIECYSTLSAFTDEPNRMWKKRPRAQLEKCCEALAYRKGFPEEVGAMPTHDEMEGKQTMDDLPGEKDITPEKKQLEQTPISQSLRVNEEELFKYLDAINNCENLATLKDAYMEAMKFAKGDKLAVNKVAETKNERKKYLDQVAKVLKENPPPTQDNKEWLDAYNGEEKN